MTRQDNFIGPFTSNIVWTLNNFTVFGLIEYFDSYYM